MTVKDLKRRFPALQIRVYDVASGPLGVGVCVLPSRMPDDIVKDRELKKVHILNPRMKRRVVAIVRAEQHPTRLIKQLLEAAVMMIP